MLSQHTHSNTILQNYGFLANLHNRPHNPVLQSIYNCKVVEKHRGKSAKRA
jgi:hypothetical protein